MSVIGLLGSLTHLLTRLIAQDDVACGRLVGGALACVLRAKLGPADGRACGLTDGNIKRPFNRTGSSRGRGIIGAQNADGQERDRSSEGTYRLTQIEG